MRDLITYTPSITSLVAEGITIAADPEHPAHGMFTVDEDGDDLTFTVTKVPVVYANNGATLSLVRGISESLFDNVDSIEVIGYYDPITQEPVFVEGGQDKYESVYDTTTKVIEGEEYTPPYMFGVFA